uniref:Uncharacterized protein n=1 Tax=Avena sativa TaxID=4498 RepID=A0ACD5YGY5_AVESA
MAACTSCQWRADLVDGSNETTAPGNLATQEKLSNNHRRERPSLYFFTLKFKAGTARESNPSRQPPPLPSRQAKPYPSFSSPATVVMSSEPPPASTSTEELEADLSAATISKKQLNKEARKAAKAAKAEKAGKVDKQSQAEEEVDPFAANYGDVPVEEIQSKVISGRSWIHIGDLDESAEGSSVLIRGSAQAFRPVSKKMAFVVLRQSMSTVQCVLVASADHGVSTQMVRFATSLSKESILDVEGVVSIPKEPLKATTQQTGEKWVRVLQDTRLNYRSIDLRTLANQAIFRIQFQVENKFREYLSSKDFIGIHSPKLISGSSEGGAAKKLGRLVKEKYGTEFFILYRYPLAVRPFYTMPCYDDPAYSNSFDVFIRGEEIISGAQRVHTPELLRKRAIECGIDASTISSYIESFSFGASPHGGFGVGLERVVMLFCALNNIRKTSLFPRDPQRLTP